MAYADKVKQKLRNAEYLASLSPEEKRRRAERKSARRRELIASYNAEKLASYKAKKRAYDRRRIQKEEVKAASRESVKRWYHTNENGKRDAAERRKDPNKFMREWRYFDYAKSQAWKQLDMYGPGLSSRTRQSLDNPWVVWELKGRRYRQRLLDTQPLLEASN